MATGGWLNTLGIQFEKGRGTSGSWFSVGSLLVRRLLVPKSCYVHVSRCQWSLPGRDSEHIECQKNDVLSGCIMPPLHTVSGAHAVDDVIPISKWSVSYIGYLYAIQNRCQSPSHHKTWSVTYPITFVTRVKLSSPSIMAQFLAALHPSSCSEANTVPVGCHQKMPAWPSLRGSCRIRLPMILSASFCIKVK